MVSIIACSFMWGRNARCAILGHRPSPNTPGLAIEFGFSPRVTRGCDRGRFTSAREPARLEETMGKLRHLAIVVKDLEASCRFYEKCFDMKRAFQSGSHAVYL